MNIKRNNTWKNKQWTLWILWSLTAGDGLKFYQRKQQYYLPREYIYT